MGKNLELIVEDRKEHNEDIARYIQHKLKGKDREIEEEVRRKAENLSPCCHRAFLCSLHGHPAA
jgi:hypothetical protein